MKPGLDCDAIWDALSAYADDEATPAEIQRVESHVAECAQCAAELAFMRSTASLLADTPLVEPPVGLHEAILAATVEKKGWLDRVRAAARAAFAPAYRPVWGLAAAAACAIFVLTPRLPHTATGRPGQPVIAERPNDSTLPPIEHDHSDAEASKRTEMRPALPKRTEIAGLSTGSVRRAQPLETSVPRPHVSIVTNRQRNATPRPSMAHHLHPATATAPDDPDTTPDVTAPAPEAVADAKPVQPAAQPAAVASVPTETRLGHLADTGPVVNSSLSTLAGLKASLRQHSTIASRTDAAFNSGNVPREVQVDVIYQRF